MNFFQIETFLTIVNTKSLSRAAEILYLTQPTVSHRLKSLEDELGIVLLDRKKGQRTIDLTEKGQRFIPIANRWLELWQDIQLLSADETNLPLTLGCMDTLNAFILSPLYKKIARRDGDALFDLHIKTHDTSEIYRLAESREIDVGLVFDQQDSKNLIVEPLFAEELYIIRLLRDPDEIRTAYHPSELEPDCELFFNCAPSYQSWHAKWWSSTTRPYVNVDSESLILDFLDHEDLWAVVPASVARSFEKHGQIKAYEILDPPSDRICYRITHRYPKESHIKSIQLFHDYLLSYIESLDYVKR